MPLAGQLLAADSSSVLSRRKICRITSRLASGRWFANFPMTIRPNMLAPRVRLSNQYSVTSVPPSVGAKRYPHRATGNPSADTSNTNSAPGSATRTWQLENQTRGPCRFHPPQRQRPRRGRRSGPPDQRAALLGRGERLPGQPGLAHPRSTGQHDTGRPILAVDQPTDQAQLLSSPGQRPCGGHAQRVGITTRTWKRSPSTDFTCG